MPFLKKLLKHMEFVEVIEPSAKSLSARQKYLLEGLEHAVEQVNLHRKGKVKLKPVQQLLDELM
jgi:hypothetical protein